MATAVLANLLRSCVMLVLLLALTSAKTLGDQGSARAADDARGATSVSTATQPASTAPAKAEIDAFRAQALSEVDAKIAALQGLFDQLPDEAKQHSSLRQRLDQLNSDRKALAEESDAELASDIAAIHGNNAAAGSPTNSASAPTDNRTTADPTLSEYDQKAERGRDELVREFTAKISAGQKHLMRMVSGSAEREELSNQIRDWRKQLNRITNASRDDIRRMLAEREEEARVQANAQRDSSAMPRSNAGDATSNARWATCPTCGGLGEIGSTATGSAQKMTIGDKGPLRTCPTCGGTGKVLADGQ